MPLPVTRPRNSLVAAASSYKRSGVDSAYALRKAMDWQRRALTYIDIVPELSYSSRFYSRMLRQLRVFPAVLKDNGQVEPITSGPPVEELNRLKGRDGTMKQILGNFGRLMFATGEGNLLGVNIDTDDEYWSFVWLDEVVVEMAGNDVGQILWTPVAGGATTTYGPEEARVFRLWTPHPRRTGEPDSPMRSVLDIAEELVILTAAVRSTAVSRTVAGLLLMPSEMAPLPAEPAGDEDPENDIFVDEMLTHFESQLEDAGSAAASMPWVLWGAYELIDKIRRVDLHDPQTDYMERDLRNEAIDRLAHGLDYPPEVLKGLSSANHWAAKQIFDDMWRSHGAGIADQFVGDLNEIYLRPMLRAANYPDWQHVIVAYDESKVVLPPDQSADADAAFDRGALSNEGYRKMKNIPEEYKPSEEEHDEYLAIKLKDPAIAGLEASTPVAPAPPAQADEPPPPGPEGDSGRKTRVVKAANRAIEIGASEMALARCRELAGIRIKQREKAPTFGKTPEAYIEVLRTINGQPNSQIAAFLGAEKLAILEVEPAKLVKGGADTLQTLLVEWGYGKAQSTALAQMVESYAARTLFKAGHPTLPSGFAAQFERAREASDVSD